MLQIVLRAECDAYYFRMKISRQGWLWFIVTTVVLGLGFYNLSRSAEWRGFHWSAVWEAMLHARPSLLLTAVLASILSYVVRAYRWRVFLDPIKKGSLWILFLGQIFGFSSIFLIGRPGELVRPAYIARREHVPFSAMMAIWVLERVFDLVFIAGLLGIALEVIRVHPKTERGMVLLKAAHWWGGALLFVMLMVVVLIVFLRLRSERIAEILARTFRFLPLPLKQRSKQVFWSFCEGLDAIRNAQDLVAGIASTAVLWFINTSYVWLVFQSLGGELRSISWIASALVLFVGAVGLLVQLPGVGGGFQEAIIIALTRIFAVSGPAAAGAGMLLWIVLLVPCVALSVGLLVIEGLWFGELGKMAEEERAALPQKR